MSHWLQGEGIRDNLCPGKEIECGITIEWESDTRLTSTAALDELVDEVSTLQTRQSLIQIKFSTSRGA